MFLHKCDDLLSPGTHKQRESVCVRERERERDRDTDREKERGRERERHMHVGEYVVVFIGTKTFTGKVTAVFDDGTCEVHIPKRPPIRLPQEF